MANNIEKQLQDFGKQAQSMMDGLTEMVNKVKQDLTPEQQKEVDEKLKAVNIDKVTADFAGVQKEMSDFLKQS
jgi:Spy/CpxP family protein refolding chaperone